MKRIVLLFAVVLAVLPAAAQQNDAVAVKPIVEMLQNIGFELSAPEPEIEGDVVEDEAQRLDVQILEPVPMDGIERTARHRRTDGTRFLPMSRRVNRNIDVNKFVYGGEWMLGLTASYGTLSSDNSDLLLILDDINIGLKRTTVRPFLAYAYRDNRAFGVRVGYEMIKGSLDNISLNLGSDAGFAFSLGGFGVSSESMSVSLFHRNYMGFDRRGIVGMIIESELQLKSGLTATTTGSGESATTSKSQNFAAKLSLNPGLAVYIFPEVCCTVTLGIGGIAYNSIRQLNAQGDEIGRRQRSYMRFKLNIADIQIGVVAHLWNKKKK